MKTVAVVMAMVMAMAATAEAKPAHVVEKQCYTQEEMATLVNEAVSEALQAVQPTEAPTYQLCRLNKHGVCRTTRTFLKPVQQ